MGVSNGARGDRNRERRDETLSTPALNHTTCYHENTISVKSNVEMTQGKGDIGAVFPGEERKTRKEGLPGRLWYRAQRERHGSPDRVGTSSATRHYKRKARGPPEYVGRPSWKKGLFRRPLEDDLRNDLHVEWLAGSDAGSAVEVPYGVSNRAIRVYGARARGKVDAVKEVKHFGSKLDSDPFRNRNVLKNREVHALVTRADILVASDVSGKRESRYWVRGRR